MSSIGDKLVLHGTQVQTLTRIATTGNEVCYVTARLSVQHVTHFQFSTGPIVHL